MLTVTTAKILYADDDSDDRFLLNEYILSTGLNADIVNVTNGLEAISYVEKAPEQLPSLIILDLNMPKMNGKETLRYLKTHPRFHSIPIFILSTSENETERRSCTASGAHSYFVKPNYLAGYAPLINACLPFVSHT